MHTFVCPARNKNLGLNIEIPAKVRTKVLLEGLAEADTTLRVGVVVRSHRVERLSGGLLDPYRRGEVHVALSEIDAVRRKVRGAGAL